MKRYIVLVLLLKMGILTHPGLAAGMELTEEVTDVLRFGKVGGDRLVIVDNLFGSIEIKGYDGEEVRLTVRKTIVARSEKRVAQAREEVTLDIYEEEDVIELYVDGPFRRRDGRGIDWRGYEREGYKVIYDFELSIPEDCAIELMTVDDGDISVESVSGDFEVSNVNGRIEMEGIRGSGEVSAINGKVSLEFETNPRGNCSVKTINGDVRLYFQPNLSADFYLKSMNGEAFTDFEMVVLPVRTETVRTRNGKNVYKVAHMSGVRAGTGGPEITLNTLNGDMFILSK